MIIVMVENVPKNLKGRLSTLLIEIRSGIFIGNYSNSILSKIKKDVRLSLDLGSAIIAWDDKSDFGFNFVVLGSNRTGVVEIDGIKLASLHKNA